MLAKSKTKRSTGRKKITNRQSTARTSNRRQVTSRRGVSKAKRQRRIFGLRWHHLGGLGLVIVGLGWMVFVLVLQPIQKGSADSCIISATLVNSCRPWLGAYATGYPNVANGALGQVENHESRIGRQLDIVHTSYHTGASQLTSEEVTLAGRANTSIFLNWKPTTGANAWLNADGVANGGEASVDTGIVQMADSIKAVPSKVMLTIWHEPENDVSPGTVSSSTLMPGTSTPACPSGVTLKGTAGSPAQYVAMWQNVENIFKQQGVTNVVWVMTDETYAPFNCLTTLLYPGNNLVDWMAYDTYNQGLSGAEGTSSAPFEGTAGSFYNHLLQLSNSTTNFDSKPWAIGEWGSCIASYSQAQVNSYYADAKYSLDNNLYPRLKLYTVFDAPGSGNTGPGGCQVGYTPNGVADPTTQADYNAFADDPRFTDAYYTTPPPDTTPPTASISAPANGASVSGILSVSASASDNVGVSSVALYVDNTKVANDTSSPYSFTLDTTKYSDGTHNLFVEATDAANNQGRSGTVSITVNNATSSGGGSSGTGSGSGDSGSSGGGTSTDDNSGSPVTVISASSPSSNKAIPVSGTLVIAPSQSGAAVQVSIDGKKSGTKINTAKLTNGVHTLTITENGKTIQKKIAVHNPWPVALRNDFAAHTVAYVTSSGGGLIIIALSLWLNRFWIRRLVMRLHGKGLGSFAREIIKPSGR